MKAINVIKTALLMINESDLYNHLNGVQGEQEKFNQDKELLIKSLNEALYSVSEYYPLVEEERHAPINGKIEYKNLRNSPYKIVSVKGVNGEGVLAEIFPTYIQTSSECHVTYKYYAKVESLEDEIPYSSTAITENTLAYGLISEFLTYKGRFNEALSYSDRFVECLIKARNFLRRKKLSARKWF